MCNFFVLLCGRDKPLENLVVRLYLLSNRKREVLSRSGDITFFSPVLFRVSVYVTGLFTSEVRQNRAYASGRNMIERFTEVKK